TNPEVKEKILSVTPEQAQLFKKKLEMNNEISPKRDVYEILLERAKTDKDFFSKLRNDPEKFLAELKITNPEVKEKILSVTPEQAQLFKKKLENMC
ncbi:hypothetical protein, partial [Bacillus sp. XF8]|uniref:hypothetical protein n=1 Tax=Bacillus sp. XF8 TaxID=2819289 RepID=UPI001AA05A0C